MTIPSAIHPYPLPFSLLLFFGALGSGCGEKKSAAFSIPRGTLSEIRSVIEPPAGSTLILGRGYNSLKGEALGPCVQGRNTTTVGGSGQSVSFALRHVDSLESLSDSLNLSIAGSYGKGLFRGSAKASLLRSTELSTHSSFLLVSVKVENQTDILETYEYTEGAKALLKQGKRNEFLARCGDEFVAARTTGGEFTAIVEFTSKTQEQKHEIESQIKLSGGVYKLATDFKSSLEKISKYTQSKVTILRAGGSGSLPDISNLVTAAISFPEKISSGNSWPYSVTTVSYDAVLDGAAEGLPRPVSLSKQAQFLEDLFTAKVTLVQLRNDALYILRNQNQFQTVDEASLKAAVSQAEGSLQQLEEAPERCFDNPLSPQSCRMPPITFPTVSYPARFSNANAVCAWRREDALKTKRISRTLYDGMVADNTVPLFAEEQTMEVSCEYYVTNM